VDKIGPGVQELLHELSVMSVNGHSVQVLGGPFVLTNYMFWLLVALVLTLAFFIVAARSVSLVPRGIGNLAEAGVEFVRDGICVDVMGPEGKKYFPFVATAFFFILFNNLIGLIPGAKAGTGTMGTTVTWALMVFVLYNFVGFQKHGAWGYIKSFAPSGDVNIVLKVYVWVLEVISHLIRPLTLSVRLFANLYAGHVTLGVFALFVVLLGEAMGPIKVLAVLPWALQIVMYAFEVFVALIQAYVFAILTAVYIGGAIHAGEH
jgi:F-type H+-transporting ATPase subunit a